MPTVETSRGTFRVADHRHANEQLPSIIIHGAGGSHLTFPRAIRRMKAANALLPDLSGHGLSKGNGHQSIAAYAADIVSIMDSLDIPESIFIGHSMGGAIAQTLALDYSDRVRGLVLIGTGARFKVNPTLIDGIVKNTGETIAQVNQWMWSKSVPDDIREQSAQMMQKMKSSIIQGDYIASDRFDIRNRLHEISVPTLVIAGTEDKMTRSELSTYLADHITDAELVMLEGAGHMMMLEQPEATAAAIEDWLQRIL